ncbi:hypothetical protein [Pseudonocardia kunmingensis]|nr:hypothetical protein [Pseudonocardia kunmingensis]
MAEPPPEPRPPSWAGAPGYSPYSDDLPPHAPMPGAPPYPAAPDPGRAPVARPRARTRFRAALGATAVWAAVNVVLVLLVSGAPDGAEALGRFVGGLLVVTSAAALALWLVARRRTWSFWMLVVVAAPLFWVLRAVLLAASATT